MLMVHSGSSGTLIVKASWVPSGDQVTFAFLVNIPPEGDPDATTALQDRLVEALVTYPDVPDPATLGPDPVVPG